jgi:hypothetical protein
MRMYPQYAHATPNSPSQIVRKTTVAQLTPHNSLQCDHMRILSQAAAAAAAAMHA